MLQRATQSDCGADNLHGCNLYSRRWGRWPSTNLHGCNVSLCCTLGPDNTCMLEGKANVNKRSRSAPLACYCVWKEDVAAPFIFLFKADAGSSGFILFVCFMKWMFSKEYVVPEEQR